MEIKEIRFGKIEYKKDGTVVCTDVVAVYQRTQKKAISKKKRKAEFGRRLWAASDDNKLLDMVDKGYDIKDIAKHLSRTPKAIQLRLSRLRRLAKK